MQVLVLGGTRFIGAAAVRALVAQGHAVAVYHRGKSEAPLPESVRHVHGDRRDVLARAGDLGRPEAILDLRCMEAADAEQTLGLARTIGARRVVVASSADVYRAFARVLGREPGPPDAVPLTEDSPVRERRYPYRADPPRAADHPDAWQDRYEKLDVEERLLAASDVEPVVVRLPMVHGPADPRRRVWASLRRMTPDRDKLLLPASRAGWRACRGYVDDAGLGLALAVLASTSRRVYHLADPALTEREWVEAIARAAQWPGRVIVVPDAELPPALRPEEKLDQHLDMDTTRARTELGWAPQVDTATGIARTIAYDRVSECPPEDPAQKALDAAEDNYLAGR